MIEYPGNEFSETMEFSEAMEKFQTHIDQGEEVRALHIGTPTELNKRRFEGELKQRVSDFEEKFKSMEPKPKSDTIIIPTDEEVALFVKSTSPCEISVI